MSKDHIPLATPDISAFARQLAQQLQQAGAVPSHLSLLNMLARATGFRNFQHLRAAHGAGLRLATPPPPPEPVDHRLVERAANQFDAAGRLRQWPSRQSVQDLCLWPLWARLPAGVSLSEREITRLLAAMNLFDDPAILRRTLVTQGFVRRNPEGTDYHRIEQRPSAEGRALIARLQRTAA